jgi:hypothetical protein
MKTITLVSLAFIGYLAAYGPVRAADSCKECRDFQKACLQAHSKAACQTDYDICMKHCKQKQSSRLESMSVFNNARTEK